jgi:hypothetical protein
VPAAGRQSHISVEIANYGRAAELAGESVAEGADDRPVLAPRAWRSSARGGEPLCLAEQVALLAAAGDRRRGRRERTVVT